MYPEHNPDGLRCSKPQRKKPHAKSLLQEEHAYIHTPEVQGEVDPWSDRSHSPSWPRLSSSFSQDTRTISASSIHAGTKVSASVLCIIQRQADIQGRKKSSPLENLSEERCFLEASKLPSHWVTWIFPLLRRWNKP